MNKNLLIALFCNLLMFNTYAQKCTTLGQTPSTAFPVCATSKFIQTSVPTCENQSDLPSKGCTGLADKNPFYYKFTCFKSGVLGFLITPNDNKDDYDWQLYDVTGHNPDEIIQGNELVVTGNWAGNPGPTGASANGVGYIQCGSSYSGTEPRFAKMPTLIEGHQYILLISHFTDSQSGYSLSFGGGTATISDEKEPLLSSLSPSCDGSELYVKTNKKMQCSSISTNGSEFVIMPPVATVVSVSAPTCNSSFDTDSIIVTLSSPLPTGKYSLIVKKGTDSNTILDICGTPIKDSNYLSFNFSKQEPINADSLAQPGCAPQSVTLHFPKRIDCTTVNPAGDDFKITGPYPAQVQSAHSPCNTNLVIVTFTAPITQKGTYQLSMQPGLDGTLLRDECNIQVLPQSFRFNIADTVNADFDVTITYGCKNNTLNFSHPGDNDVSRWDWTINNSTKINKQEFSKIFPATSSDTVQLAVSNGTCADTAIQTIVMNNSVLADFEIPEALCPEDIFIPTNKSTGPIDNYKWEYANLFTSDDSIPNGYNFPRSKVEKEYSIKLTVENSDLNCIDFISKKVTVYSNCYIAVPSAFTPNGDGLNDFLYPNNAIKAKGLEFKIYNRWGQLMFETNNWKGKWNGRLNGVEQASGAYAWFLKYTHSDNGKRIEQNGTSILIR